MARRDPMLLDAGAESISPTVVRRGECRRGVRVRLARHQKRSGRPTRRPWKRRYWSCMSSPAARRPRTVYRVSALLGAPMYVAWKLSLYARAAMAPAGQAWIRTERSNDRGAER